MTCLCNWVSFDDSLVVAAKRAYVAGAGDHTSWKLTLDSELDVLRVRRAEGRVVLAQAKGCERREVGGGPGSRRDEGEFIGVNSGRTSFVEVLEWVSKARVCHASVVDRAVRIEAEGRVAKVLQ